MTKGSPNSFEPTLSMPQWGRWLQRCSRTLIVVAFVGGVMTAQSSLLAADAKAPEMKLNHSALAKEIDGIVGVQLRSNKVDISGRCTDGEFIRRAYLDITGVIPPVEKVREFLNSKDVQKRAKLIDELLESERYGKYFAEIWTKLMVPEVSNNRRLNNSPLRDWMAEKLNANTHWDKLAYDVITASGPMDKNGAVTFFVGNAGPEKVTDKVSELFLGVKLQCAQCHNHPFTDWKQDEYWGMAAFFTKVGINGNPNQAAKKGITLQVQEVNLTAVRGKRGKGKNKRGFRVFRIPNEGKRLPPSFLKVEEKPSVDRNEPYRPVLAKWITSKENRFFARAISNKLWGHFFGRGVVNPIDDMHDDNPATHPKLLEKLAAQAKANDFDIKYLIRAICNSETYQRSSRPKGNNDGENELFSHALVRQLSPEQLFDSLETVLKVSRQQPNNMRRRKVPANRRNIGGPRQQFISFFSGDDGHKPLEYQAGIPQALRLMNSRQTNAGFNIIAEAAKAGSPAKAIEHLYLATYARLPNQAETQRLSQYVQKQDNARTAYGDILWALVNSSEFALNH